MSFRLKAAIVAAFALSAAAAVTASDMSMAGEAIPSSVSLSRGDALTTAPSAGATPAVTFAAPREIVQPLASASKAANSSTFSEMQADSLAALVDAQGTPEELDGEMKCLAGAVYFESKGESLEGQLAVARVIINRAESGRFADSLCGVVYQPSQFSFVRGGEIPSIDEGRAAYRTALAIARVALDAAWDSPAPKALFFNTPNRRPGGSSVKVAMIGNHVFYR